jgi:NifU-like protein
MGQEALEAAIQDYYSRKGGQTPQSQKGTIVCTCFGVTDEEIRKVVHENDLTTVEQVTNFCKAGGGCGGCKERIAELVEEVQGQKAHIEHKAKPVKPGKLTNIQKIQLIQDTINEQIRPALRADGGDIELLDIEGNKVLVAFRGMCAQCKMAEFTMKDVVQARLREFVSDELIVEEVKD